MMNKYFISFFIALVCVCTQTNVCFGQLKTYQFEQIDSLQKIEPRNCFIFIHTNWCKYCAAMQNTTLKNDSIVKILNTKFYTVSLNAEERRSISFQNHTFNYKPNGPNTGTHELADQLSTIKGEVTYPTICMLNPKNEIIFQYNEFVSSKQLKKILKSALKQSSF